MATLGALAATYLPMILNPRPALYAFAGSDFHLFPLAFLASLTALACGAWRTAALGAYVCIPMLLKMAVSYRYPLSDIIDPLVAGATFIACLIWSYRRYPTRNWG